MKNTAKLIVISVFALGVVFIFLSSTSLSRTGAAVFSDIAGQPTPPSKKKTKTPTATATNTPTATATNTPAAVAPANTATNTSTVSTSAGGSKKIRKSFTLGADSLSEWGESPFDHENHAEKNYSPDGKSVVGCVECHHTDQPKSALKPPLFTSERDEVLTMAVYQRSNQKVSGCRDCHFQDGNVPEGKTMPTTNKKDLNNQLAYHLNCNTCHDAAFKARPDLKAKSKTFATSKDCAICHKQN